MMKSKTYISTLTIDELMKLMDEYTELKDEVMKMYDDDANPSYIYISEYLRNIPRGVDYSISNYNDYMYMSQWSTRKDQLEVIEWFQELQSMYQFFGNDTPVYEELDKATRYIEALREDDCGSIDIKSKDYNYMDKYVDRVLEEYFRQVLSTCQNEIEYWYEPENCIRDAWECDLLDGYYIQDGHIYKERNDLLIA